MFDTHVNLHADAFVDDLEDVLTRAREAGVTRFLAICDRFDNYDTVRAIAEANDDIWNTAGVHPHHAKDRPDITADQLRSLADVVRSFTNGTIRTTVEQNFVIRWVSKSDGHAFQVRGCGLGGWEAS